MKNNSITIRDVALLAGVSQATVGRVVGQYGKVSATARAKVLEAVAALNYHPNAVAQSMKRQQTRMIGVLVGDISYQYFGEIISAIEKVVIQKGYNVIVCSTHEDYATEISSLRALYSKRIDGLIIATTLRAGQTLEKKMLDLYTGSIPTVFVDREISGLDAVTITADNIGGAYAATRHLIELGHTRIGVVSGPMISTMAQRIEGYRLALESCGISFDPSLIVEARSTSVAEGINLTYDLIRKHDNLTAIFALNNLMCIGSILALNQLNRKIPADMSIIGWDDFALAGLLQITVVLQATEKIGTLAAQTLLNMINPPFAEEAADSVIESTASSIAIPVATEESESEVDSVRRMGPIERHIVLRPSLIVRGSSDLVGNRRC